MWNCKLFNNPTILKMSSLLSLLKKINFIDEGITESDDPPHIAYLPKDLHFITPKMLYMPFPTPDRIPDISQYLEEFYSGKYVIWNCS